MLNQPSPTNPSSVNGSFRANSASSNASTGMNSSNEAGGSSLARVSKESVDSALTAKDLMNQDVYDRDQKKIGRVVDVVLNTQASAVGASFQKNDSSPDNSTTRSNLGETTDNAETAGRSSSRTNPHYMNMASAGGSGTSPDAGSHNQTGSGTGNSEHSGTASTGAGHENSNTPLTASGEPQVVISHGGVLGLGAKDLVSTPLSQLRYDPNSQHLQLNVSATELTRVSSSR